MPIIATTTSNSTNEKPFLISFIHKKNLILKKFTLIWNAEKQNKYKT